VITVDAPFESRVGDRIPDDRWHCLVGDSPAAEPGRRDGQAGALAGVRLAVKDVIDVAGMPTRCNSSLYQAALPAAEDADCVRRLRLAGARVIGKAATSELAFGTPSQTRNPRHPDHTPGGSSSGSAAAVAAGLADIALGTQTGGSVIRPAAYCGVWGMKPTLGLISTQGVRTLAASVDTIGWFARSGAALEKVAKVLLPADMPQAAPRFRLAPHDRLGTSCAETRALLDAVARDLGLTPPAEVKDEFAATLDGLNALYAPITAFEAARALDWAIPSDGQPRVGSARAGDKVAALLRRGQRIDTATYLEAQHARHRLTHRLAQALQPGTVLILPAAAGPAPAGRTDTGDAAFNRVWSLAGWPALTFPAATSAAGLPIGLQLVAAPGEDMTLLAAADHLSTRIAKDILPC